MLMARVERELADQWHEARNKKDGSSYWRLYKGSQKIEPPNIVFSRPSPLQLPLERPITVVAVNDDAELSAVPAAECLWVTDSLKYAPDDRPVPPPKTSTERYDDAANHIERM